MGCDYCSEVAATVMGRADEPPYGCPCQVCGLAMGRLDELGLAGGEHAEDFQWLGQTKALLDPADEYLILKRHTSEADQGQTMDKKKAQTILSIPVKRETKVIAVEPLGRDLFRSVDGHVFRSNHWAHCQSTTVFPVHAACLGIAQRVISGGHNRHLDVLHGVLSALRWRIDVSRSMLHLRCDAALSPNWELVANQHYLTTVETDDAEFAQEAVNPLEIPGLTQALLANLKTTEKTKLEPKTEEFRKMVDALPTELSDMISTQVLATWNSSLAPSRALPQSFWLQLLPRIPYLWDINPEELTLHAATPPSDPSLEWDWEDLVHRILKRHSITEVAVPSEDTGEDPLWQNKLSPFADTLVSLPPGLINRRRIWQLCADMFVGDVIREPMQASLALPVTSATLDGGAVKTVDGISGPSAPSAMAFTDTRYGMYQFYDQTGMPVAGTRLPCLDLSPYASRNGVVQVRSEVIKEAERTDTAMPMDIETVRHVLQRMGLAPVGYEL